MGNWRTVNIIGKCNNEDVPKLREALTEGNSLDAFHCLMCGGLCGLPNWASDDINVTGNLAERDYSVEDVAEKIKDLHDIAPSLVCDIHCGGEYESKNCIKTVRLDENGIVSIIDPQIDNIPDIDITTMHNNLMKMILKQ